MSVESRLSPAALMAIAALSGEAIAETTSGAESNSAKRQQVYAAGSLPTFAGPDHLFTGDVFVEMAFPGDQTPYSGAYVTFQPGARTAWHSHPAGQHMVVTKGTAITATRDGQVVEFHEGEAVWCPEDVDHWHGATPHAAMTHFVVTNSKDGENVVWKDKVTDAQYQAALNAIEASQPTFDKLSARNQQLAAVAAFAAAGDLGSLRVNLAKALDAGISINELKEVMVHLYPYGGFPKSLNGLVTLMALVDERKASGIKDETGPEADELPAPEKAQQIGTQVQTDLIGRKVEGPLFDFAPVANTFLQKHLFGDVFARGLLTIQERELLTVSMLSAIAGTDSQLGSHIGASLNVGLSKDELTQLGEFLGHRVSASNGVRVAAAIEARSSR